jgi:hypothetical protein
MKRRAYSKYIALIFSMLSIILFFVSCKKDDNPIKFSKGTFPDKLINLEDINSPYDDYNLDIHQLIGHNPIIFSSNRKSSGGQFDLEQASFAYNFNQTNGNFEISTEISNDQFLTNLINKAVTPGNDFGPYRQYSSLDGYEYLVLSSVNSEGNLDMSYLMNRPDMGTGIPEIQGPFPVKLLNSGSDDAYICFDSNLDSAYFTSNRDGNFDIFVQTRPAEKEIYAWFNLDFTSSTKVDSINSSADDKCPSVFKNVMVFTSNRGDTAGYDLYYSLFKNGKWNSPKRFGNEINSSSDEYRPVIGFNQDFTNVYMMFSSNRPGGKGGYDLYFTGLELPK